MLTLNMQKSGQAPPKLRLSLTKNGKFTIELYWDSPHDLDVHALLAHNDGHGAKVSDFGQVLSTYNCKKTNPDGHLPAMADGSFATPCGTLTHSPDVLSGEGNGADDVDEFILVDGSKASPDVNEVPIFVTIHPKAHPATFREVKHAGIRIKDDTDKIIGEYRLSDEFGAFNAVQMGSLMLNPNGGWEYAPVGSGFNGTFNTILETFS